MASGLCVLWCVCVGENVKDGGMSGRYRIVLEIKTSLEKNCLEFKNHIFVILITVNRSDIGPKKCI